jgi:outer membrane protein
MRNFIKAILVVAILAVPSVVSAQKAFKFGHINSQEIAKGLTDMDSVQIKYQKYLKELENDLESLQVEYNNKLQKYVDEKDKLTELIRKNHEADLTQFQQRIQQYQEEARAKLEQKNQELMQPVVEKIKKAITDVGKENGFTYIFDIAQNSVVYFNEDSQDVTSLVKAKLATSKPAAKPAAGAAKPASTK